MPIISPRTLCSAALLACFSVVGTFQASRADDPAAPAYSVKDKMVVETVLRLKSFDIQSSAPAKAAMLRYLRAQPGSEQYFELIQRFKLTELTDELLAFAIANAGETEGVRAAEVLVAIEQLPALQAALRDESAEKAIAAAVLLGYVAGDKTVDQLLPVVTADDLPVAVRAAAVTALGRRGDGQRALLLLANQSKLADELHFAAANALFAATEDAIRDEAAKYFELPATADSQPLPPVAELVKRRGDAVAGAQVFAKTGTCSNCHKVRGEGKEVGPDLSEIGSKLSREAMYVSILDPSAAVSHNYETYTLLTEDGDTVSGLLVSETDQAVTLKTAEGISRTVETDAIEILQKQPKSLMPQDLQRLMTVDQLVDLVEYTMTLKKP